MSTPRGLRPFVRVGCLAAYAAVTFSSFPHPVGGVVIDLGLVIAWLGPALLILGISGLSPRSAALYAFFASWLAHSAILHWLYVVTVTYGHAPAVVGVLAPVAVALYPAFITAGFAASWAWWWQRGGRSPFAAAVLWTAFDYTRSFVLTGFPWATLGYSQHENGLLLGIASGTGVYGLSFVVFLAGAALALAVLAFRAGSRVPVSCWVALVAVVLLHGVGYAMRPAKAGPGAQTIRVAALQGNISQGEKWSAEAVAGTYEIYETLSREAAHAGAQLIVWPETALPQAIGQGEVPLRMAQLAEETGAVFVVGAVGVEVASADSKAPLLFYDSAFGFAPDGRAFTRYDKSHLVPFGEYVPFRDLLGGFVGGIATGIAPNDVTEGPGPRTFVIPEPLAPLEGGRGSGARFRATGTSGFRVGAPICYELLFPDLVRRFVGKGAGLLLALTNDAWYGRTGAPYQFLAITALRSAETGVYTVRAANSGISAIIDSAGRVKEELPIFVRGLLVADVPLRDPEKSPTLYVRYGDVFALACTGWALAAGFFVAFVRKRRA